MRILKKSVAPMVRNVPSAICLGTDVMSASRMLRYLSAGRACMCNQEMLQHCVHSEQAKIMNHGIIMFISHVVAAMGERTNC